MKKVLLQVLMCLVLTACGDGTTAQDKEFIAKIKQHLKKTGDVVKVSDIYSEDWDYVCYSMELGSPKQVVSRVFKIQQADLKMENSSDYHSDKLWGLAFFKRPDTITAFYIKIADIPGHVDPRDKNFIGDCILRSHALIELRYSEPNQDGPGYPVFYLTNHKPQGESQ